MAAANTAHVPTPWQHFQGIIFAVLVAIIWVASSELVQVIFDESSYKKPYFVSWYSISACVVCLLGFVRRSWRQKIYDPPAVFPAKSDYIPLQQLDRRGSPPAPPAAPASQFTVDDELVELNGAFDGAGPSAPRQFNARQVFAIALFMAPIFFVADWVFTIGLELSSVASSSTINTLSALFTLIAGNWMGVENYSHTKLFAAFATIGGVALVSFSDQKSGGKESLMGDMVNILSAVMYTMYATLLKKKSPHPGSLDAAMLFGFIGSVVLVGAVPGFFVLDALSWEKFELPSRKVAGMLLVNSLIGTVLSEYLWARSIVLTTPMIGTLALSLTVPLSLVVDYFYRSRLFKLPYLIGATLVLVGFFLVNLDEVRRRKAERSESDGDAQVK